MSSEARQGFWAEALTLQGAVSPRVIVSVLVFGLVACAIWITAWFLERVSGWRLSLEVTPHELAGAALGILLVMRTNAGYDRWWEARKLWGGFVDRCRNVVIGAMAYGPRDPEWQHAFARWVAAYPHIARHSLRAEQPSIEVAALIGQENANQVAEAEHMPSFVALQLAELLQEGRARLGMDAFSFLQVDRERALLVDNFGGCERILNTPLPRLYSTKIRQFLVLYLTTLPFALLHKLEGGWLIPFVTMFVAYPLLSLDQIGVELENPFSTENLSHLPLDDLASTIERNVLGVLKAKQDGAT